MRSALRNLPCLFVLVFRLATTLPAEVIKLGSLAPADSPWDRALRRIAQQCNTLSDGRLVIKVYPGGIAGDELNMVRKIRINQLQAAAVTGVGLGGVCEDVYAVQFPLLIRTDAELDYVMKKLEPALSRMFEAKGLVLLAWFPAGWARFFTKTPAFTPEALKHLKLHVDYSVPTLVQVWQRQGFRAVPLSSAQVLPALQNGVVEAFLLTPLAAALSQWFGPAPNMVDLPMAPMLGGIVISRRCWESIAHELKPQILACIRRELDALRLETAALEAEALQVMLANGLQVHEVSPQVEAEWQQIMSEGLELVTGTVISADVMEEVRGYVREYRSRVRSAESSG